MASPASVREENNAVSSSSPAAQPPANRPWSQCRGIRAPRVPKQAGGRATTARALRAFPEARAARLSLRSASAAALAWPGHGLSPASLGTGAHGDKRHQFPTVHLPLVPHIPCPAAWAGRAGGTTGVVAIPRKPLARRPRRGPGAKGRAGLAPAPRTAWDCIPGSSASSSNPLSLPAHPSCPS